MNDPLISLREALDHHPAIKKALPRGRRYMLLAGKAPTIARYFVWIAHPAFLRDWANRIEGDTKS